MQSANFDSGATRAALVDALAGEHRLRREAVREQQEAERWAQRAAFAQQRGLDDLVEGAQARSNRHTRVAATMLARADEIRAEAHWLRESLDATRGAGRAPPPDHLDRRFAELEIEAELKRLRQAKLPGSQSSDPAMTGGAELEPPAD